MNSSNASTSELGAVIRANFAPLCVLFGLKLPVLAICILLSITPIYLTFKSKRLRLLRSNCNLLIALNFLNTALQLPAALISATVVLSGQIQIRLANCFPLQIVPYIGATMQWAICFAIALDRLVGLFFPFFYSNFFGKRRIVLVTIASVCYAFTLYKAFLSYTFSMASPEKLVICGTTDIYPSQNSFDVMQNLAINVATASCYIFLWAALRCKLNDHNDCSRRIFRSVSAIMLLEVLGWLTNNLLRLILPLLKLNTLDTLYYSNSAINCMAKLAGAVLRETATNRNSGSWRGIGPKIMEICLSGNFVLALFAAESTVIVDPGKLSPVPKLRADHKRQVNRLPTKNRN
uniref:G-protein coupled receptors family 1 profile domain-containing protein n=1 Tax=Globodera rostochiensis TaxID=31243 RepID=A0A914HXW0_GLORO